ncbi:4-diphosphocytidyl-2C-methyl-D-erythritol kinase [Tolumonas auensis DSM 9187]|uniref:4-diphosphocytidyl-2-C-methyl-D-erythritol kinase n=1 Tax=Tolumonas auensis (strain DSM 9187 / NBRC 110442 / TA 4) TaxID=595494 RepID=ISPE_TOLAT|nr:4-(cytidine 5'-diphospho)-2-C-methyl-D-erythritol kinase [Tolumonas auensis]C4LBL2.1 RecName: Full=4-diphosphocytidyl-2-C-methyl-D-erythritol kinase; Short=CMK; AltName: Full=4-(cytidine-5'-diphospho)-2-C-methyl-D-erythritol kinase [Tolumonas auensis DSM 9187]ACQ92447.1 4-diphosphocytidyl-2C-methyl-D-erythritol kinase [Tolumonas auensis DSM 9187]
MSTPENMAWPAPAKLNLFLHVNGRRSDGYHELQTLFIFLDHCDWLRFHINNSDLVDIKPALADVPPEQNLIYRAAMLLKQYSTQPLGVMVELDKRLPMGGGIGGGSSDAATTLVALNYLWKINLPVDELAELGRQLGADVPVFVRGHAAFAEGVGEKLLPVEVTQKWYLVLVPECHVSTAEIFRHKDLKRDTPKQNWRELQQGNWHNDCEPLVKKNYPEVEKALRWLIEYAPSRMTGTGACVFAEFKHEHEAREVLALIPTWLRGFVARGENLSPLHVVLQQVYA